MSSLFLKIVNMSIAASWLILAVILLRVVLKKAPKWINVLLWGAVAIRLLCPITIESNLSMVPSAEVFPNEVISGPSFNVNTGFNIVDTQINDYLGDRYFEGVTVPANNGANITTILSVVWIVGIFAFAVFAFVSYRKIHNKVSPSLNVRDNIWICDDIQTPFILGCFKPSIYIPSGTDEAQLPYIIAHENAHLKRCDHWWKPLGYLVLAIHWFNPLVWIAYILLCRDIELACDEKVIRELNQNESISYSEALLSCSVNRRTVMVCPLAFGEVGVKERVKRVLNYKKPAFWIIVVALLSCIVMAVCFLTNPIGHTQEIMVNGIIYVQDSKTVDELPEGSVELGFLKNILHKTTTHPTENFSGTNLNEKYAGCSIYQSGADKETIYLEDYSGFFIPFLATDLLWNDSTAMQWFDYLPNPSGMTEDTKEISLPEYPGVTFHWNPGSVQVTTDSETIELYTGMPIWNVFFYDLTGDGKPELCSTVSYGSGIIDNRILIYDYANGASYELSDRGFYDFTLRYNKDGHLYVDKTKYNTDELIQSGRLLFKDNCIQVEGFSNVARTILKAKLLEIDDGYFLVEPVEGSWELNSSDRIQVSMKNMNPSPEPEVGDILEIEYNGEILETYPAQLSEVYHIAVIQNGDDIFEKYYLTIGADNVKSIELTMPNASGGCENADGLLFKKGERIWLENLDGYDDLRGVTITALDTNGEIIWTASIPDGEDNQGFTHLTNDDWTITNIK